MISLRYHYLVSPRYLANAKIPLTGARKMYTLGLLAVGGGRVCWLVQILSIITLIHRIIINTLSFVYARVSMLYSLFVTLGVVSN